MGRWRLWCLLDTKKNRYVCFISVCARLTDGEAITVDLTNIGREELDIRWGFVKLGFSLRDLKPY